MKKITFLGCSPSLNLDFETQITMRTTSMTHAVGGDSIERISCPYCKIKISAPSSLINNYLSKDQWLSQCCDKTIPITQINWRKSAGFSQAFIQINNIFPKEAIPTDEFMLQLSEFSQTHWKYFYSKQHTL